MLQKELDNINSLVTRGMAVNSQKINLQQSVLQSETSILDIKLLALKAQQEVSKIARNVADLHNQWRNEALAEFNKSQQALANLAQQAQLAKASAGGANPPSPNRCEEARELLYLIVRGSGGVLQAFPVAANDGAQRQASAAAPEQK